MKNKMGKISKSVKGGRGEGELFNKCRVSVLQDEKVLELCCSIMRM